MIATDVVKLAQGEIGYAEKATNSSLANKTANAGHNNWTKYAQDLHNAGYYNGNKNGYAWCDVFVDWCFWMAANKNKSLAEKIQCQTGTLGAGCTYSKQYYEQAGRFDKNPKVGDQIFFRYSGSTGADHTGLVVGVTSTKITTIEGNSGDKVQERSYRRSDSTIVGYGHPRFDEAPAATTQPKVETTYAEISIPVLQVGSSGQSVKALQRLLHAMNYYGADGKPLEIDGKFGPNVERAVKKYQKLNNLTITGICDQKMWVKTLGGRSISMPAKKGETTVEEKRYKTLEEIPEAYRAGIKKLIDAGSLKGKGGTLGIDLTEDMIRALVVSVDYADKVVSKVHQEIADTSEFVGSLVFKKMGVAKNNT